MYVVYHSDVKFLSFISNNDVFECPNVRFKLSRNDGFVAQDSK